MCVNLHVLMLVNVDCHCGRGELSRKVLILFLEERDQNLWAFFNVLVVGILMYLCACFCAFDFFFPPRSNVLKRTAWWMVFSVDEILFFNLCFSHVYSLYGCAVPFVDIIWDKMLQKIAQLPTAISPLFLLPFSFLFPPQSLFFYLLYLFMLVFLKVSGHFLKVEHLWVYPCSRKWDRSVQFCSRSAPFRKKTNNLNCEKVSKRAT